MTTPWLKLRNCSNSGFIHASRDKLRHQPLRLNQLATSGFVVNRLSRVLPQAPSSTKMEPYCPCAGIKLPKKLTDLPNIGNAIATDLMAIGIRSSDDLKGRDSLKIFNELKNVMEHRHDPCVYYTLLSVEHFMQTGVSLPWWKFTAKGKADLALNK